MNIGSLFLTLLSKDAAHAFVLAELQREYPHADAALLEFGASIGLALLRAEFGAPAA